MSTAAVHELEAIRARYVELLLRGDRNTALREATAVVENGVALADFVLGVLAPAQAAVGLAWQDGAITHHQEKIATDVAEILLTVAAGRRKVTPTGMTLAMCVADREHHNLPARMVAELLRADGHHVAFLGMPRPQPRLTALLKQMAPDAVVISCSLSMNLPGVVGLAGLAHDAGIPVIVGGAGFAADPTRARRVGADAHAGTVAQVGALATESDRSEFAPGPPGTRAIEWAQLAEHRRGISVEIAERLMWHSSPVLPRSLRTPKALAGCVADLLRFVEAGTLVDEHIVVDYACWLVDRYTALRAEPEFVPTLLTAVRDHLDHTAPTAASAADAAVCTITTRASPHAAMTFTS